MTRKGNAIKHSMGAAALVCFGAAIAIPVAVQPKALRDQLVGTWTLKSDMHEQNGRKTDVSSPNPHGYFMFTPDGHFSVSIVRSDIPKFGSIRNDGTADENKAVVQGSIRPTLTRSRPRRRFPSRHSAWGG